MKRLLLLTLAVTAVLTLFSSCHRTCTCITYNGNYVEYTDEELEEMGLSCVELERFSGGGLYSICEKTF